MYNVGQGAPYMFDYINLDTSNASPSTNHCKNSNLFHYFRDISCRKQLVS